MTRCRCSSPDWIRFASRCSSPRSMTASVSTRSASDDNVAFPVTLGEFIKLYENAAA